MVKLLLITMVTAYLFILNEVTECSMPKGVSRFARDNIGSKEKPVGNTSEFEKFFLKASKSVPRIGRRGFMNENLYGLYGAYQKAPLVASPPKRTENLEAPFWSDIAHLYEYNADLPNILQSLSSMDSEQGDDPSVYDFNKYNMKTEANDAADDLSLKETPEYRFQPEVQRYMI